MSNIAKLIAGVNIRSGSSTSLPIVTTTSAPTYALVYGLNTVPDADGYLWLALRLTDGTEGYVRIDKVAALIGDFSLIGGGKYDGWVSAGSVYPYAATGAQVPPVAPQAPPAGAGKLPCPVNPSTNENGYGHVYAGVKHDGCDLAGPLGSPVLASASGIVALAQKSAHGSQSVLDVGIPLNSPAVLSDEGWNFGYGNVVIVRYARTALPSAVQQAISAPWVYVLTAHCLDLTVVTGGVVGTGMVLGHRGKSANANGVHVHLQVMVSNDAEPKNLWGLPRVDPNLVFQLPAAT